MARLREEDDFGLMMPDIQSGDPGGGGGGGLGNPPIQQDPDLQDIPSFSNPIPGPPGGGAGSTDRPREIGFPGSDIPGSPGSDEPRRQPGPSSGSSPSSTGPTADAGGGSEPTPTRPRSPSPVAAGAPQPFTPLQQTVDPMSMVTPRDPGATNVALRAPSIAAPTMPSSPTPTALRSAPFTSQPAQYGSQAGSALFGKAGGLLGGGLGVSRSSDEFENQDILDALIRTLLNG